MSSQTLAPIDTPISWEIQYKSTWAESWGNVDENLILVSCQFSMAPIMPRATIIRYLGQTQRLSQSVRASVVQPLDLSGKFVRIRLIQDSNERFWYGYCPDPVDNYEGTRDVGGTDVTTGITTYNCYGMEWFLRDTVIKQCIIGDGTSRDKNSNRVLPFNFNISARYEKTVGNRSLTQNSSGVYEFSSANDAVEWTGGDVVKHMLEVFKRQTGSVVEFALTSFTFAGSAESELNNIKGSWDFDGLNFYDAIQRIIGPENAFGFYVEVNQTSGIAQINVCPSVSEAILDESSNTIVTPASTFYVMDLDSDSRINRDQCTLRYLSSNHYDKIEVRGDWLRVAFTLACGNQGGTFTQEFWPRVLKEGWTSAQATAYDAADDKQRRTDEYTSVYRRFVIENDWNGNTGPSSAVNVFPVIKESDGSVDTAVSQKIFLKNRVLDRTLPWADIDNESQPRKPFVIWIDEDDQWRYMDNPGSDWTALGLDILDNQLGIKINTASKLNHIAARNRFSATSDQDPEWDYTNMFATVSMRTDERVRVVVDAPDPEPGEIERVKIVDLPQYALWWIAPNTVKNINTTSTGVNALDKVASGGEIARDDTAQLLRAAQLLKELYGRKRQILDVVYDSPDLDEMLGFFVDEVTASQTTEAVKTQITNEVYRFETDRQSKRVNTSFSEFNVSGLLGRTGRPTSINNFGFSDELANIPARVPDTGGTSGGSDPFYFPATKLTDTTVQIGLGRYRYGKLMNTIGPVTKTIPTVDGRYVIYFQALYDTSYAFSIEVGERNQNPDQSDETSPAARAWREEICEVTVANNVISSVKTIWPGHVMSIEGRLV